MFELEELKIHEESEIEIDRYKHPSLIYTHTHTHTKFTQNVIIHKLTGKRLIRMSEIKLVRLHKQTKA